MSSLQKCICRRVGAPNVYRLLGLWFEDTTVQSNNVHVLRCSRRDSLRGSQGDSVIELRAEWFRPGRCVVGEISGRDGGKAEMAAPICLASNG